MLELLANERRRELIKTVYDKQSCTLDSAVDAIADAESNGSSRNSIRVSIKQNHLSKLQRRRVVKYDSSADVITAGETFSTAVAVLETINAIDTADQHPGTTPPNNVDDPVNLSETPAEPMQSVTAPSDTETDEQEAARDGTAYWATITKINLILIVVLIVLVVILFYQIYYI